MSALSSHVFNNKTSTLIVCSVFVCMRVCPLPALVKVQLTRLLPEVMLTCQTSKRKINKHTVVGKHCYYREVIVRLRIYVHVRANLLDVNVSHPCRAKRGGPKCCGSRFTIKMVV